MGQWVFFVAAALLSLEYGGHESGSKIYMVYWAAICLLSVMLFAVSAVRGQRLRSGSLNAAFLLSAVCILLVLGFQMHGIDLDGNARYARIFAATCVPSFVIGSSCALRKGEHQLVAAMCVFVDIGSLVMLRELLASSWHQYGSGRFGDLGGLGRLGVGYLASQFFVVTLYRAAFRDRMRDLVPARLSSLTSLARVAPVVLLPIQLSALIGAGSRGPLVVCLLLSCLVLLEKFKQDARSALRMVLVLVGVGAVIYAVFVIWKPDFLMGGARRTFSLFELDSTEWAGGTGRESLYLQAISMFADSPLLGYGPMGFLTVSGTGMYPHNVLLEFLVDYGLIGSILWVCLLIGVLYRVSRVSRSTGPARLLYFLLISVLVELLFSHTLWVSAQLWFFVGYGVSLRRGCLPRRAEDRCQSTRSESTRRCQC